MIKSIFMCYNIAYLENRAVRLAQRYSNVLPPAWKERTIEGELPGYFFVSGFSHPELPVIGSDGIGLFSWGLIPFWVNGEDKAGEIRSKTLNAVGETVFSKPSFKRSILRGRCLLPVSGFFEWRHEGREKLPYYITGSDQELISLGCISESWTNTGTGEVLNTFSIITTPVNEMLSYIHNNKKRMPLVIPKDAEKQWVDPGLDRAGIEEMIRPCEEEILKAHRVSTLVNNPRNQRNVPAAIQPL